MNRNQRFCAATALLFFAVGAMAAQTGPAGTLNSREARQELEVMEGVLETTLKFALYPEERITASGLAESFLWQRGASVGGFYLYGQGAVFFIRVQGVDSAHPREMRILETHLESMEKARTINEAVLHAMEEQLRALGDVKEWQEDALRAAEDARLAAEATLESAEGETAAPVLPMPSPLPPKAPAPPMPAVGVSQEELKLKVEELKKRLAENREEQHLRQEEFERKMETLKQALVEAVAKHGSSLTTVKSGEYINLIVTSGDVPFGPVGYGLGTDKATVLSIPRQAVDDFRSGSINLQTFRQQVIEYEI